MARKPKSTSVYVRIEDKLNEIKAAEELLVKLNEELQELYSERDQKEMRELFIAMRDSGLTIEKATELLQSNHKK